MRIGIKTLKPVHGTVTVWRTAVEEMGMIIVVLISFAREAHGPFEFHNHPQIR